MKTPTMIRAIEEIGRGHHLIVCPASLIYTWAEQIKRWAGEKTPVYIAKGKKRQETYDNFLTAPHAYLVMSNKNAHIDIKVLEKMKFDVMVIDEAHFLRNYNTAQSKALVKLGRRSKKRYALTGTPTTKHPSDVYGILHFLKPSVFTSYWGFCDRYFDKDINMYTGNSTVGRVKKHREQELQELVGMYSVARKRKEVMPWLPEKDRTTLYARMTRRQQQHYEEMARLFYTQCMETGEELDAPNTITQTMRLRQLVLDPRMCGFNEKGGKTEVLMDWLKEHPGEPVVIMSMFTSYLELLKEDLIKDGYRVGTITGKDTGKAKQDAANEFQSGQLDILLCNIISAGTGWTLDRGDTVIFLDSAWNPSDNEQAEDRVCPTTQDKNHEHRIIHISVAGTIDDKMFEILARKKDLTLIINENAQKAVKDLLGEWKEWIK